MMRRYPPQQEFLVSAKLIKILTSNLANIKDWSMEQSIRYIGDKTNKSSDMVYRWQQGRSLPKLDVIEILAQIGRSEADLSREWCEKLLHATHYPDTNDLLNNLWGPKELRIIPYWLPHLQHTRLIGRQEEAKRLQELLSPRHAAYLITVDGIGGVGKTALVLDVAYQSLRASSGEIFQPHIPIFDMIIFVSAQPQYLTAQGIFQSSRVYSTLRDILHEITLALKCDDIQSMSAQRQSSLVREMLGRQRTLLIVDNLETMQDKQEILSFLYELPSTVKVVITTRERVMFAPIRLEPLVEEAALELIEQQAEEKQVHLSREGAYLLYQRVGGIPTALIYAVGQRAAGYSLETVLTNVSKADGDVARFCFQSAIELLRDQKAYQMFMAFALFPKMVLRTTVTSVAGLETDLVAAEEAFLQLQRLSLIREFHDRFRMLPLTREYALAELRTQPKFEEELHERWLEWYQNFAHLYGGHDTEEWHIRYNHLDEEWENLLAVFDWCASHEKYEVMKSFWCAEESSSVVDFTHLYGYWDDRLNWLHWLMRSAEGRRDWVTVLHTVADIAKTLAFIGCYDEAEDLFKQSQNLYTYADPQVQVRLLINHMYLYILIGRFEEAGCLLEEARVLVPQLREPLRTRANINIDYNYAIMQYLSGNLAVAKTAFTNTIAQANCFGWLSLVNSAQNYLADIVINQGNFDEAERLLEQGLVIALRNRDKQNINSYNRSFAYLRQKQNRLDEARTSAREALHGFEYLRMQVDARKISELLQTLDI